MSAITAWRDAAAEARLRAAISADAPWDLVLTFSRLVRLSGSHGEREAVDYLTGRLREWGVPHQVHWPELFISIPRHASLTAGGKTYRAKTPAMSVSTGAPVAGELVYLPSGQAKNVVDVFSAGVQGGEHLKGKVVLTEGFPMPGKVADFARLGVKAAVFISPGRNIHDGICTTIWGAPDLDNAHRQPTLPVLAVNSEDGKALIALSTGGPVPCTFETRLDTGWQPCPVIEATIPGSEDDGSFVLLHGHLDSWDVGVGDNATGDACLLECARVFWQNRDMLRRTIKVCWWSGHSHGRYAGSTWWADQNAVDLYERCIAHVNCDSPGCRWATVYEDVMWMAEAADVGAGAIRAVAGLPSTGMRPLRAGDCTFNNLGVTTFYMGLSTMPQWLLAEKGYYPVGGCGGNIAWHTEDDTLEIADRDILLLDTQIYATAVLRAANAPIYPFDYGRTAAEIAATARRYGEAAAGRFDLSAVIREAEALQGELERFYASPPADANRVQRALARLLVPVGYARLPAWKHDPALEVPPLPDLEGCRRLAHLADGSHEQRILLTHLTRGRNRVLLALRQARQLVAPG